MAATANHSWDFDMLVGLAWTVTCVKTAGLGGRSTRGLIAARDINTSGFLVLAGTV